MRHSIQLNIEEKRIIEEISRDTFVCEITEVETGLYVLELDDDDANNLSEMVKDRYTYEGFDKNYFLTEKGRVYECLVDKFVKIGW